MKTYLDVSYFVVLCVLLSPANLLADENTERALAAENKMLKASIANLRAEIAKLKAEIKQLKEPPKQSNPTDGNSGSVVASPTTKPKQLEGNDVLVNALIKYSKADRSTEAQREEAYAVFCKESRVTVTVTFVVENVRNMDNNTVSLDVIKGVIESSVATECPLITLVSFRGSTGYFGPTIKMSPSNAAKIKKGSKFTVKGIFDGLPPEPAYNSWFTNLSSLHDSIIGEHHVAIKNPAFTLDGQPVQLAK